MRRPASPGLWPWRFGESASRRVGASAQELGSSQRKALCSPRRFGANEVQKPIAISPGFCRIPGKNGYKLPLEHWVLVSRQTCHTKFCGELPGDLVASEALLWYHRKGDRFQVDPSWWFGLVGWALALVEEWEATLKDHQSNTHQLEGE